MTVTAVVVGHQNAREMDDMLTCLRAQTRPIDQFIVVTCCMAVTPVADICVQDIHREDWGQTKCDIGLRLSTSDYTFFASSDDYYEPEFVDELLKHDADLILSGFNSRLAGIVTDSQPTIGRVTRGSFLVRTSKGQAVGYNHRHYEADGQFVLDLIAAGATWVSVPKILYQHR